ncbi:Gfo/Idh/MocA family protein [Cohnella hashimotonis]|uniref:Gfo/Idh/MocA family oxidoreductase n=1 Tax=Cohnella hashimotonis TaxID=2826895 RepID=A0ABT6TGT1_9BACL|nr:Gfo/Idh/MocA family oxidoreductase [Cohnella hashimotonis]MDI4645144.1 Gfo/Idh/MocA family oxidoreductase [Cohnella hashimotonis]
MKNWRIGLIGTGWWSDKHLQAWSRIPNAEIAALCNRSPEKLAAKAEAYRVPASRLYRTVDEMLERADIDVVDIVTGPETHLEMVKKATAAGKHILCQKPFAPTLAEAEEMVRLADKAGVRLMVTENWRWLQPFQLIKSFIDNEELGLLRTARYYHTDFYTPRMTPDAELPQPFFRSMPKLLFYEMGVHWFDTWRFLFGTPDRLYAETARISPFISGEDSGIVVLGYDNFYGYLDASWATRQQLDRELGVRVGPVHLERLVIEGDRGTLKLHTSGKITIVSEDGSKERVVAERTELDQDESHFRLQSHFINCLNTGHPFQTSGAHNLITLRLAFGVYESASRHEAVLIGGRKHDH